jgi:hypothetical protein
MDLTVVGTDWYYTIDGGDVFNESSWRDDNTTIGVQFTFPSGTYDGHSLDQYRSTLFFTPDDWASLTDEQVVAIEHDRHQGWINLIYPPVPSVEDLQAQIDGFGQQVGNAAWNRQSLVNELLSNYPDTTVPDWPPLPFTIT